MEFLEVFTTGTQFLGHKYHPTALAWYDCHRIQERLRKKRDSVQGKISVINGNMTEARDLKEDEFSAYQNCGYSLLVAAPGIVSGREW